MKKESAITKGAKSRLSKRRVREFGTPESTTPKERACGPRWTGEDTNLNRTVR